MQPSDNDGVNDVPVNAADSGQEVVGTEVPTAEHLHDDMEAVELEIDLSDSESSADRPTTDMGSIELDVRDSDEPVDPPAEEEPEAQMPTGLVNIIDDDEADEIMQQFDSEQQDAESIAVEDIIVKLNVDMNDLPFKAMPENMPVAQYLMSMPADMDDIERLILKYDIDFGEDGDDPTLPNHVRRLRLAIIQSAGFYQSKYFEKIFDRPGSQWGQGLKVGENALLRQSLVHAKDNGANPVASILTQLDMGTVIQIPLWHSGIWIAIKKPRETDLLNLEAEIAFEKATLGRATNGAVFSNNEVYAKKAIVDFALRHVVKATTESIEPNYLANVILETDWPMLAWGLVLADYPKGYRHLQPCVATPETCDHVIDTMLNIGRLCWVDQSRFTAAQVAHMKNRVNPNSLEKIRTYQEQHRINANATIKIDKALELELRVPTIAESIATGIDWVQAVTDNARKVFTSQMSEGAREAHKNSQATLASIRQYVQWFGSFRHVSNDKTFTNKEMVEEILAAVNERGDFSKLIHARIREYIDDSTLATIALPKWTCPKCQKEPSAEYLRHPQLIPIDIIDVFFTLLGQKIKRRLVEESTNVT